MPGAAASYGLQYHARSIAAQIAEQGASCWLAGTTVFAEENEVHPLDPHLNRWVSWQACTHKTRLHTHVCMALCQCEKAVELCEIVSKVCGSRKWSLASAGFSKAFSNFFFEVIEFDMPYYGQLMEKLLPDFFPTLLRFSIC